MVTLFNDWCKLVRLSLWIGVIFQGLGQLVKDRQTQKISSFCPI